MEKGTSRSDSGQASASGTNHLFVVGIDKYLHIRPLINARRDAEQLVDELTRHYNFDPAHLTCLYDEDATLSNLTVRLHQKVSQLQKDDNLVIYFSGHGHFDPLLKEGYWLPVDAGEDGLHSYLPYSYLQNITRAAEKARHVLFLIDSCYSGAVMTEGERSKYHDVVDAHASRWMVASGRNEVVSDGEAGKNSPFADQLLYFLENSREKGISTFSLIDLLMKSVTTNSRQTPIGEPMRDVGHRGGQFVFRPKLWQPEPEEDRQPPTPGPDDRKVVPPDPIIKPTPVPESPVTQPPAIKKAIHGHIGDARTERAINELEQWITEHKPDMVGDILQIKNSWSELRRKKISGVLRFEDEQVSTGQIVRRILMLVTDLP